MTDSASSRGMETATHAGGPPNGNGHFKNSNDIRLVDNHNKTNQITSPEVDQNPTIVEQELPFLVTHWLANYGSAGNVSTAIQYATPSAISASREHQDALDKIRRATSDLASAFATLGAYGPTLRPTFGSSVFSNPIQTHNATFSDVRRKHTGLSTSHLEHLAQSVAFNSATANTTALDNAKNNLLLQATSMTESMTRGQQGHSIVTTETTLSPKKLSGRNSQDAVDVDNNISQSSRGASQSSDLPSSVLNTNGLSILHNPALIAATQQGIENSNADTKIVDDSSVMIAGERKIDPSPTMSIKATYWDVAHQTATAVRQYLTIREKIQSSSHEMQSLEKSLKLQQRNLDKLNIQYNQLIDDTSKSELEKVPQMEEIQADQQGCNRVLSQLQRKLGDLQRNEQKNQIEIKRLQSLCQRWEKHFRQISENFHDPFIAWKGTLAEGSKVGGCTLLQITLGRQHGLSRSRLSVSRPSRSILSTGIKPTHFMETRKNLLACRLSHAVTINTHGGSPAYCLRFDRTGRYFITAADDFLIKVFYLGAAQSCRTQNTRDRSRLLQCNYGANFRGAVLVCTLRGHAGVVNDIAVSTDNCFLATASVDGDVRVWGLKNGCPVAILRGHKEGANMVKWCPLTPYRLISCGSDGFARVWDIREACLKRYGKLLNQRGEYILRLTDQEKKIQDEGVNDHIASASTVPNLPPLPVREDASSQNPLTENVASVSHVQNSSVPNPPPEPASPSDPMVPADADNNGIIVPPLPAAVPPLGQGADAGVVQNERLPGNAMEQFEPGQFVANDLIDEGVKLLAKYQHGVAQDDQQQQGPGTRSRRGSVNVICVARSPLGNQFASGSDDGILRVWQVYNDHSVAMIDKRLCLSTRADLKPVTFLKPPRSGVVNKPILKLTGHMSTITDLAYSYAGDRILSASQKDGIVRIWNVSSATSNGAEKRVTQIVIKLVDPSSTKAVSHQRRRPGNASRSPASKVSCDVAVWTHDDSQVVTSQCVLVKQSGNEIHPGSQFVFLWDSKSGRCLMGISGAHAMQCNVVIPHPFDNSIVCTAAHDGIVKVWDWGQGKCIFSHQNKVEYGPSDANNPKSGGYLDGVISPDGSVIVLTDDAGQVTVLDSIAKQENPPNNGNELPWMREQYFATDYYELVYDVNGYCVEKGSEMPPHLAPRGARCTYSGAPYSDEINETYKRLAGPMPIPEDACRWKRESIRSKTLVTASNLAVSAGPRGVRIGVREFDPLSTIIIKGSAHVEGQIETIKSQRKTSLFDQRRDTGGTSGNTSSVRNLSANYRYLDYEDLLRREVEDDDSDSEDEEFEPETRARRLRDNAEETDGDDDDLDGLSMGSDESYRNRSRRRRGQASQRTTEERRVRAQRRAQRRDHDFIEIDSDDDLIAQYVSGNTEPTGSYLRDYSVSGHLWKLRSASDVRRVHRKWLHREESATSYFGKKNYTPQLGDSVVYIPRAHFETIKEFPSLSPPWQDWPTGTAWPVVRCFVRAIRFRFPYEDYFRRGVNLCKSIVAILTLEVTGIPELSDEREFPWPKSAFVEPTRPFVFEVSLFENTDSEFILPECLYKSRIEALESSIRAQQMIFAGLPVDIYYESGGQTQDSEMEAWAAKVVEINEEDIFPEVHLRGSGYRSLQIEGDGGDAYMDSASPWELNTDGTDLLRPTMTDDEKKSVLEALNTLLQKSEISTHFALPVDTGRYSDYEAMIEVPMDFMFIKRRLNENFYGSKFGVVSDLRLICDNCIKYNTAENEISKIAVAMCTEFEDAVLTEEEKSQFLSEEDFEKIQSEQSEGRHTPSMRIRLSARRVQEASAAGSSSGNRYTLRDRSLPQRQTSLENLPAPVPARRSSRRNNSIGAGRARGRYNLRGQGANEGAEELSLLSGLSTRRGGATAADLQPTRRSNRNDELDNESMEEMSDSGLRRNSRSRPGVIHRGRRTRGTRRNNDDRNDEENENNTGTRTRAHSHSHESHDDEDNDNDSESAAEASRSRAARRRIQIRSTRAGVNESTEEHSDDDMEEDDAGSEAVPKDSDVESQYSDNAGENASSADSDSSEFDGQFSQARRRASTRRTTSRSRRQHTSENEEESPGRRSTRRAARVHSTYEEVDSDEEQYREETSESERDVEKETEERPRRNRSSHSAGESDESSASEEEESDYEETTQKTNKRKSTGSNSSSQPARKRQARETNDGAVNLPDIKKWPTIPVAEITKVTKEMLKRLSENDERKAFAVPVVETYPNLAEAYYAKVNEPMDLRTIEEDRLPVYTSIEMLQDDLILMYRNGCTFNEPHSEYWDHAYQQWETLNDVFYETCQDLDVMLPRRWSP